MSMIWLQKRAKYFILTFGVLLVLGLVMMGPFDTQDSQTSNFIGKVNGVSMPLEQFRKELDQYQEQQRNSTGKMPDGLELVTLRKQLFDYNVNSVIMSQLVENYKLFASGDEMWNYLETNPDPMIQQDSMFQTNGSFDRLKYIEWLHQDNTLNIPYMRYLENRMKSSIIPEIQIRQLIKSQYYPTYLENAYEQHLRKSKAKLVFYKVSADSFNAQIQDISDEEMLAYFNAHPDSFFYEEESAVLGFIKLNVLPSANDTALAREIVEELEERIKEGENFDELAISYSDDDASAEKGGKLDGFTNGDQWVSDFREAALNLLPGEVSSPVMTKYGIHLIRCDSVKEEGEKQVDVSHILIKINPSPETADSLEAYLDSLKNAAGKDKSLESLAQDNELVYNKTKVFYRWNFTPLGEDNYLQGLHSFAFGEADKKSKTSDVLQNDNGVYLAECIKRYPPGRNFERSKEAIRKIIQDQKKFELARLELEKYADRIRSGDTSSQLGKAVFDSTNMISSASWVSGFGYNNISLAKVISQEPGIWGEIYITDYAAVMGKVIEKEPYSLEQAITDAHSGTLTENFYVSEQLQNSWFESLVKTAEVLNNLDLVYRN